uniref:Ig-like domain-containing protein n=1 Tax=Macrostomum lignano TaxID=282301 RepID=A0A1I8HZK6_9PLAT
MASMCRCWVSLVALIGLTCLSYSTAQFVVPEFSSQPEPLTYARPNSTVRLSCTVRSAATAIQCGYRRGPDANIRFVSVNTNIMTGVRCLSNGIEVNAGLVASPALLADYEFFCKAVTNTNFALIGSPFRVNIVDRYRVVRLSTGSAALIIGKVLLDDGGKRYGCLATNPVTRQTVQSRVETLLIVKHAVAPRSPITVAAPAPREITLTEGDNATYSCITESSPIAEVSYLRDSGRRQLPASATELREFGLLQFTGIGLADQGAYACRVSYRPDLTSSGHMRDEKKLEVFNIAVK